MSAGKRTTLELAWRYTDFGTVVSGRGAGRVVWRDASRDPLPLDLAETRADLASHGLHVSIALRLLTRSLPAAPGTYLGSREAKRRGVRVPVADRRVRRGRASFVTCSGASSAK